MNEDPRNDTRGIRQLRCAARLCGRALARGGHFLYTNFKSIGNMGSMFPSFQVLLFSSCFLLLRQGSFSGSLLFIMVFVSDAIGLGVQYYSTIIIITLCLLLPDYY